MAVYYNDADPAACAWLRDLIAAGLLPDGEVDERSILEVEPADLRGFAQCHFFAGIGGWPYALRLAGVAEDLSVWTGSPPCQPFSQAGQRKGQDDDRHLAPPSCGSLQTAVRSSSSASRSRARQCSDRLAARLEQRLRIRLAGRGSTLWRLTWKRHLTPSRRPICRLRASARRTSASACSSAPSPWSRAGWATASARDHKDGSECRSVPINALLGRQVWLAGWPTAMAGSPATAAYNAAGNTDASRKTVKLVDWSKAPTPPGPMRRTASGEIRTGSSAAMAAGGPLSPEHSRWLMGYPAAWGSCGATAMRSCRRSRRNS
jgi:hypothetical protein